MIDVWIWIGVWVVILIMLIISLAEIESRIAEDIINKIFEDLKERKREKMTMPRYIDADALREKMFHEAFEKDSQDQKWDIGCWIRYHMFEDAVDSIPTADVVERKRGKWTSSRPDAPMFGFHYCSLCGRKRTSPQDHYCPNCGAQMDERSEDE